MANSETVIDHWQRPHNSEPGYDDKEGTMVIPEVLRQ